MMHGQTKIKFITITTKASAILFFCFSIVILSSSEYSLSSRA